MTDILDGATIEVPLAVNVRVVGVGVNQDVAVTEGSPLAQAIAEALGASPDNELTVQVNGETVDPEAVTAKEGDVIVVVPPAVKLG